MQNMRSELEETTHARSQLERLSVHLAEENRQLKSRLEMQNQELSAATMELKSRFMKLDEDTRHIVGQLQRSFFLYIWFSHYNSCFKITCLFYLFQETVDVGCMF